jgi:hypothetical protein
MLLLAMLLLARPHPVLARTPALDVPVSVEPGQRLEIRWDGLPGVAREAELELSLDGGRWLRISPELEARDGRYVWRVPALSSARARLRLRAGGSAAGQEFEDVVATSAEFRIESREAPAAMRASGPDWWHVGEHTATRGWEWGRREATLSAERAMSVAEPDTRSHDSAPVPSRAPATLHGVIPTPAPHAASANLTSTRRQPLRL